MKVFDFQGNSDRNDLDFKNDKLYSVTDTDMEEPYVFISYSHFDSEEVLRVIKFLRDNHFNFWYDESTKSGIEWADEISKKIKQCKQFICFISQNSIRSESVKDEIHIAWKYNINTIVIYLEKIELDGGLEMKLDRKQAIFKYKTDEYEFQRKLSLAITQDVVNLRSDKELNDVSTFGKYEIIRKVSKGGTATIYLAKNKITNVFVILKHAKYDATVSGQRVKKSFERERDILSKNISPFVPVLYDYFCDENNIYIVESCIEGESLGNMPHLPLGHKIEKIIQVARIVKDFHNMGIYHCDIKPEHIIVNHHGCFLIDFGSAVDSNVMCQNDVNMGTVTYAAPEQFISYNGEYDIYGNYGEVNEYTGSEMIIDERTDIYALGKTLIKILSDTNCVDENTIFFDDVTTALFSNVPKTIEEFSDNPLLQAIIEKMVRDKKSERYSDMYKVIKVFEDFLKIYKE